MKAQIKCKEIGGNEFTSEFEVDEKYTDFLKETDVLILSVKDPNVHFLFEKTGELIFSCHENSQAWLKDKNLNRIIDKFAQRENYVRSFD
jgi:hypothetical protein